MKRTAFGALLAAAVLLVAALPNPADAHGWRGYGKHGHGRHGYGYWGPRVHIRLAPAFWWGPGPAWYGPPAHACPPRVIVREPAVYIQRGPEPAPGYWYYCESARDYYPSVRTCREPWVRVLPRTE